jgi:membrane protein required for beta-lactamase induction
MAVGNGGMSPAVTMAVYAALVYDVISATNSSPQTTEINAAKRADTLMKWVHVGLAQAAIFAVLGIALEARSGRPVWPPALGSGMAGGMLYIQYIHARNSGVNNPGASTEEY